MTRTIPWVAVAVLASMVAGALPAAAQDAESAEVAMAPATDDGAAVADPFKPLLAPPPPPPRPTPTPDGPPLPPKVRAPEPVKVQVLALAGEEGRYVAVLDHDGAVLIVETGFVPEDGSFEVRDVREDGVEIFDRRVGSVALKRL